MSDVLKACLDAEELLAYPPGRLTPKSLHDALVRTLAARPAEFLSVLKARAQKLEETA